MTKVSDGITASSDMLEDMSKSPTVRDTGIFIPDQVMKDKDFKKSIDQYSFADGKGVQLSVVLDSNPYSEQAIATINQIKKAVANEVDGTPLEDAQIVYGGVTSMNADLKELSTTDFSRTMVIMIIGTVYRVNHFVPLNDHADLYDRVIAADVLYVDIHNRINFCKRLRKRGCQLGSSILQLCHLDRVRGRLFDLLAGSI